jgi:hypothetical protein
MTKPLPVNKHRKAGTGLAGMRPSSNAVLNVKKSRHLIDDISFSKDFIVCTCAWKGEVNAYQLHRKIEEPTHKSRSH